MTQTLPVVDNEMEALRLTNQRLLREIAELTRRIQRPQERQQAPEGHDNTQQEIPPQLGNDDRGETSRTRGLDPNAPNRDDLGHN